MHVSHQVNSFASNGLPPVCKQVIKHATDDVLNVDGIKRAVLASLKN